MSRRKKQSEKDMNVIDLAQSSGLTLMSDSKQVDISDWLPTGIPHLDRNAPNAFSRIAEMYAKPGAGKSVFAIYLIKLAQSYDIPVVLIDVEGTSTGDMMIQLGADPKKIFHIQPERGQEFLTVEGVTKSMRTVVDTFKEVDTPVLVVWDSLAYTPAEAEMEEDYNPNRIGTKAKIITHMLQVLGQSIGQTNILFLIINQARDDLSNTMFPTIKSSGGNAMQHGASTRYELQRASQIKGKVEDPITGKSSDEYIGHILRFVTKKSKLTAPNRKAEIYLMSEPFKGIDFYENLVRSSIEQYKFIKKAAGWRQYKPEVGEQISLYEKDWVDFVESEEGHVIALELFVKQMEKNFPEWFAPLDNKSFDIRVNPFYAEVERFYKDGKYPTERYQEKKETKTKDKKEKK